eukprot:2678484-Pyramimonas_sp.AAC.1
MAALQASRVVSRRILGFLGRFGAAKKWKRRICDLLRRGQAQRRSQALQFSEEEGAHVIARLHLAHR